MKLPAGFAPVGLQRGWVLGTGQGGRVSLLRLTDRRLFRTSLRGVRTGRSSFAVTRGRAYMDGEGGVYTVRLPKR